MVTEEEGASGSSSGDASNASQEASFPPPQPSSSPGEPETAATTAFKDEESKEGPRAEAGDREDDDSSSDQQSPRGVLDTPITGATDSDSSSSSGSGGGAGDESSGRDGLALESHSLQWRALISGLLRRKKPTTMRRMSTFPQPTSSSEGSRRTLSRIKRAPQEHRRVIKEEAPPPSPPPPPLLLQWKPSWRSFDYQELAAATDNFSPGRLLGKGGHAEVYRGCLPDGQLVAVKKLTRKKTEEERVGDFLSELGIIAHVNHPNAACLLGFGVEGGLHLVLKFSPHGSLASVLHGSSKEKEKEKEKLGWETRFKIALGVAEGLLYLHQGCHRRIIHRDIKASNILLTHDYDPQISDFGLAKWLPDQWNHHVVFPIEGTFGYLAPEYFMHGVVSEKTDVFAYGVLLLELITGRRAVDSCRQSLVIWAKPQLDAKDWKGLVDPALGCEYDSGELSRSVSVAAMCIDHLATVRPHMHQVVQILRGGDDDVDGSLLTVMSTYAAAAAAATKLPNKPPLFDAADLELEEDYTSSKYLADLNRHKQLALEQ